MIENVESIKKSSLQIKVNCQSENRRPNTVKRGPNVVVRVSICDNQNAVSTEKKNKIANYSLYNRVNATTILFLGGLKVFQA